MKRAVLKYANKPKFINRDVKTIEIDGGYNEKPSEKMEFSKVTLQS